MPPGFASGAGTNANTELQESVLNQNLAGGQASTGAGMYGGLYGQGQQQYTQWNNLLNNYLGQFGNAAGLGNVSLNSNGNSNAGGVSVARPGGGATATPGTGLTGQPAGQPQQNPANPYSLNPNQQTYVNSQVDALNAAKQNAISAYQGHLSSLGQVNPQLAAEGSAAIDQHFAGLVNQTQAGAQMAVQQQRVQDLGNLLNLSAGEMQQGAQQEEAGAGGTLSAGGLYNNVANTALSGSGQQAQIALQDAATNPLGSVLGYLGNLLGPNLASAVTSAFASPTGYTGATNNAALPAGYSGVFGPPADSAGGGGGLTAQDQDILNSILPISDSY